MILNGGYGCFSGTTHLVILAICMHDFASITGMWQLRQVPTTVKKYELIRIIITYSKYFPLSDWLKPHAKFTITSCCSPNLERIFPILNQWHQKWSPSKIIEPLTWKWCQSAAHCRLLNHWLWKPGDKVVLYLVSVKTKSVMAKLLEEGGNILNE